MQSQTVKEVIDRVTNQLNSHEELNVEYYEIVDGDSLQSVNNWQESDYIVGCIAVFCGDVRLIDNIVYKAKA